MLAIVGHHVAFSIRAELGRHPGDDPRSAAGFPRLFDRRIHQRGPLEPVILIPLYQGPKNALLMREEPDRPRWQQLAGFWVHRVFDVKVSFKPVTDVVRFLPPWNLPLCLLRF